MMLKTRWQKMIRKILLLAIFICTAIQASESDSKEELVSGYDFQNKVIRYNRSQKNCDSLPESLEKEFACAAKAFYGGNYSVALSAYRNLVGKDTSIDKSILSRIARSELEEKQYEKAKKTIDEGERRFSSSPEWKEFADRVRLDLVLENSKIKPKAKADSIEAFLKIYGDDPREPKLRYKKGVLLEQARHFKAAKKAYLYVIAHPSEYGDAAWEALRRIRELSPTESLDEKITYANRLCSKGFHKECSVLIDSIFALDAAKAPAKDSSKAPELKNSEDSLLWKLPASTLSLRTRISLWENRANAYKSQKQDTLAIKAYRFLIDSVEARATWLQSLVRLYRANRMDSLANQIDSLFQEKFRYTLQNANNIWVRAFEFEQQELFAEAIASYDSLNSPKFKQSNKQKWANFRIALCYLKQNKIDSAIIAFNKAKASDFLWSSSGARMFLGDIYYVQNNPEKAKEAYLDCIKDFPVGYYAHRSRVKLVEYKLMDSSAVPWLAPKDMSDSETTKWIRSVQGGASDTSHSAERYQKVKRLLDLGFAEEAYDLFHFAKKKNKSRLDFLYSYASLFLAYDEIIQGYALARSFQNIIPRKYLGDAPRNVMKVLYPMPFRDKVFAAADSSIDPFFVYSVMRQESTFNYLITSPANACGLLQIIPPTAKKLAKAEGLKSFSQKLLYNPYVNIRLGVRYLKDLLVEYDNDPMYVLANYNAGPKPAKRWQAANKDLPWDLRAEEISYWETRDYVKRVLGNYWVYTEIWNR